MIQRFFSPILIFLSGLLFLYTFYKSEIFWKGDLREYYKVYYLFTLTAVIFSLSTLFFSDKIKQYLFITIISTLLGVYFVEIFLTIKKTNNDRSIRIDNKGKEFDTRSRTQVYKDLKNFNQKVALTVSLKDLYQATNRKLYAFTGVSNTKTIRCNETGEYSFFKSDRFGFNNPNEIWDKKKIKYLIVGDSFAEGACVNRPHDLRSVISDVSGESALTLGVGGIGPLSELAILREYLIHDVENLIWLYYEGNDLKDLEVELNNPILKKYFKDELFTQNLKEKQKIINEISRDHIKNKIKIIDKEKINFNLNQKFLKLYHLRQFLHIYFSPNPNKNFKYVISKVLKITKQKNINLYFVYLPEYNRYKLKFYPDKNYIMVKKIVENLGIKFIDINKKVFQDKKNSLELFPFEKFGHYTKQGYAEIGEEIYNHIK